MDFSWLKALLEVLFGQIGVVSTILVAVCAYITWLYEKERALHGKERESHENTRKQMQELGEKRFAVILEAFKVMEGFKKEIEELAAEFRRPK